MRFVPTYCIRIGMKLGDNLYGGNGELVLAENTILTDHYIEGIRKLSYNGIYITDDISRDIEIVNVINDNVRAQTIKSIKNVFISSEDNSPLTKSRVDRLVSLLLDQDLCLLGILDEIRSDLLKSIKSTVSNRSMANKYTLNYNPAPNGSYLNYSK